MSATLDMDYILTLKYRIGLADRAHAYMACINDMLMETDQVAALEILESRLLEICALDGEIASRVNAGKMGYGGYDTIDLDILARRLRKQLDFARNLGEAPRPTAPAALQLIIDCKRAELG